MSNLKMIIDRTDAVMDKATFDNLPEYSCSIPTGVTIGKMWKIHIDWIEDGKLVHSTWMLGSYEVEPDQKTYPGQVRIMRRRLHIV